MCKKRAMNPANCDIVEVGDTSRVLILRNLRKEKNWPGKLAYSVDEDARGLAMLRIQ